jgi:hypothetical protein
LPSDDRALVIREFDTAVYPGGLGPALETVWVGIYQVLWWYEHGFLHIREANDLKKATWQRRAGAAESYISRSVGIDSAELQGAVDRMMRLPRWKSLQRQNPLGKGFRVLVGEILSRWGDRRFSYREEENAALWFPGITMPGRSETPRIDVLAVDTAARTPRAVVSCKWSIRHDRISDPTNECTSYKSAAIQRQLMDLRYYVVTNETDVQRLDKVVNQPCVDALVHVHLDLVRNVYGGLPTTLEQAISRGRCLDLVEFVHQTAGW